MQTSRSAVFTAAIILALTTLIGPAVAPARADYPNKPIRIIVPFAAGGGTDLIARTLAAGLSDDLGQSVIVENRPGGGTIIGTDVAAKSAPDGYTLVMATFAHAINPSMQPKLPYNTETAFAAVSLVGRSFNVLVVDPASPFHSVADIIAAAKASPGKLTFASQGVGTSAHLAGELFKNLSHIEMTHVPYRGASPALTDLIGGRVDMMFATSAAVTNFISANQLRPIAITASAPVAVLANIPTVAGSGLPGYAVESWYGLYAPAGTPPQVIARLNGGIKKAVRTELFQKRSQDEGLIISAGAPEELDAYVRAEIERWKKIVSENKITAE
jgi:tripartite-type tricarboxylate transporter receptor subunit TctC